MDAVLTMLPGMGVIVAVWSLLGVVCFGLGWSVLRLAGGHLEQAEDRFAAFWVGWATVIAVLQVWHLFWPVQWAALVTVVVLGVGGLLGWWRGARPQTTDHRPQTELGKKMPKEIAANAKVKARSWPILLLAYGVVMIGFALWLANRAMGPLHPPYDAGLYHLNGIRWMTDYPAVPGLGNLHIRFASMPSYFLYMGLMEAISWGGRSWNMAHGLLLCAAVTQMVWSGLKAFTPTRLRLHDLIAILFFPIVLRFCFLEASSTAYDLPVFVLGFVMCVQLARLLDADATANWSVIGLVTLSVGVAAITIKISAGVLVAMTAVVLSIWALKHGLLFLRGAVSWLCLPVFIGAGWVVRNVIFSGYPLSPAAVLGMPVEWRVQEWEMVCQAKVNMAWARDYKRPVDEVLSNWNWVWPWFKGVIGFYWIEVTIPLAVFLVAASMVVLSARKRRIRTKRWRLLFLLPPLAALVFWFLTAPDQRFAGAAFWWLAAAAIVLLCDAQGGVMRVRCWVPVLLFSVMLILWFNLRLTKYTRPGPLAGGYYPIPTAMVKDYTTASGLQVSVPVTGDQVWDSSLPATPYPKPTLRLRRPDDMKSGFSGSGQ